MNVLPVLVDVTLNCLNLIWIAAKLLHESLCSRFSRDQLSMRHKIPSLRDRMRAHVYNQAILHAIYRSRNIRYCWELSIFDYTCISSHLASAIRSHSLWKTANLGSRRIASGNWLQARSTSSVICSNIMEFEMEELGLIGLRITLRGYSLDHIQKLWSGLFYLINFFYNVRCIHTCARVATAAVRDMF